MKRSESLITTRGRTTVPPEIRHKLGLIAGTRLGWKVRGDGTLLVYCADRGAANPLDRFDPERYGGEATAFAPVGREIGSPDYERLTEQGHEQFQSNLADLLTACSESPEFKKIILTGEECDDTANVQTALHEFGHDVNFRIAAGIWKHYSDTYAASWMAGAETVASAKQQLYFYALQGMRTMLEKDGLSKIEPDSAQTTPSDWSSFLKSGLRASDDFMMGIEKLDVPKNSS